MKHETLKKLVTSGMMVALTVALSGLYIPVGASKCFPIQHMMNVLAAVLLGPGWGVGIAFAVSLIRNLMGTGSLLAFPGSMVGALCCGLVYQKTKKYIPTFIAEVFGTGVLGGMLAYPVAVSTAGGTLIAAALIAVLARTHALSHMRDLLAE